MIGYWCICILINYMSLLSELRFVDLDNLCQRHPLRDKHAAPTSRGYYLLMRLRVRFFICAKQVLYEIELEDYAKLEFIILDYAVFFQ